MCRSFCIAIAFAIGCALTLPCRAHPADQSAMRARVERHTLAIRMTFSLLTLTRFVAVDADGDGRLAFAELKAAEPAVVRYLNEHVLLEVNGKKTALGPETRFDYLWPRPAESTPMLEPEYALQKADVAFDVPLGGRMLEDFWIGFQIFEQTGPLQTITAVYEQDGQTLEVPFSVDEPEYLYDTGYKMSAEAAPTGDAPTATKAPASKRGATGWLLGAACVLLVATWWKRRR